MQRRAPSFVWCVRLSQRWRELCHAPMPLSMDCAKKTLLLELEFATLAVVKPFDPVTHTVHCRPVPTPRGTESRDCGLCRWNGPNYLVTFGTQSQQSSVSIGWTVHCTPCELFLVFNFNWAYTILSRRPKYVFGQKIFRLVELHTYLGVFCFDLWDRTGPT